MHSRGVNFGTASDDQGDVNIKENVVRKLAIALTTGLLLASLGAPNRIAVDFVKAG